MIRLALLTAAATLAFVAVNGGDVEPIAVAGFAAAAALGILVASRGRVLARRSK